MIADQHLHAALGERHALGAAWSRQGLTVARLARVLGRALRYRAEELARGPQAVATRGGEDTVGMPEGVARTG